MFSGLKIFFQSHPNMEKESKRTAILKKLCKENGGQVLAAMEDADDGTYFISEDYSLARFYNLREESVILNPNWISDSIDSKGLKPIFPYLTKLKHKRTKSRPEEQETDTESESEHDPSKKQFPAAPVLQNFNYNAYECERETPLLSMHNQPLIYELSKIEHARYLQGEKRSQLSYRRAIASLKSYPEPIKSAGEVEIIRGIGRKISHFVGEFIETGKISEAERLANEARLMVIDKFCKIYGVGPTIAHRWYDDGKRSISDVKNVLWATLNHQQQIGLKYYDDFNHSMTREQVKAVADDIFKVAHEVLTKRVKWSMDIVGGYSRGKLENNDLDMIIWSDGLH